MSQGRLRVSLVSLGVGLSSLVLGAMPATAITWTRYPDGQTSTDLGWTDLGWAVEGRAGARGGADYEYAIGPDGAQSTATGTINRDWTNGIEVPWLLTWDGTTADFCLFSSVTNACTPLKISYSPAGASSTYFNGVYLQSRATTQAGRVSPETTVELRVTQVNGADYTCDNCAPLAASSSTAPATGTEIHEFWFASDTQISSLLGFAQISWPSAGLNPNESSARSRLTFKLRGFDTGERPPTPPAASVPEPSILLGLLTVAALGIGSRPCPKP